jgi:hypothetical protein
MAASLASLPAALATGTVLAALLGLLTTGLAPSAEPDVEAPPDGIDRAQSGEHSDS